MLASILKALVKNLGVKKTANVATSKPVRTIAKQIVKREINKKLK